MSLHAFRILSLAGCAMTILALAPMAHAQIANPDPAAVKPGAYTVEPGHTRVLFSVSHFGFSTWYGDFSDATGALVLDPARPSASHLDIKVPVASISTTNTALDTELKGADWFDVAKFPTAAFVSHFVALTGPGTADVTGDLTFHGVTRPLVLHVKFNGAGVNPLNKAYTAGFEAHGVIHRSEFGVSKYAPLVGEDVELILSGAFEKAAS